MTAVADGRKDDWLALFADDAVVEDPVGPSPLDPDGGGHHGHAGIRKFWDRNFGAVSRFHFRVKDSFANGSCCANLVSITMWLGEGGTTMTVDGVMIYTINDDGLITAARLFRPNEAPYGRVEVLDRGGNKAWSNALWIA